jgi:hypothetical protein
MDCCLLVRSTPEYPEYLRVCRQDELLVLVPLTLGVLGVAQYLNPTTTGESPKQWNVRRVMHNNCFWPNNIFNIFYCFGEAPVVEETNTWL